MKEARSSRFRDEIANECEVFGPIKQCQVDCGGYEKRLMRDDANAKVYVEFANSVDAVACQQAMNGRQFDGRHITCLFVSDEDQFRRRNFGIRTVNY